MIRLDSIDRAEALRYLAYRGSGDVDGTAAAYMDECEQRLLKEISPKFIYKYFPIDRENNVISLSGTRLALTGNDISAQLEGCSGAVLMAVTIGAGADRLIRLLQIEDMAKAVIADAFSGAAVEQVCNEAEKIIKSELPEKYFTWRYSPGYGDFPLDIQKKLLDVIDAPRKIGLCVLDSGLLTPVKSVTAVIGVSDSPLPAKIRGCVTCNMRETCQFRKRGLHCGF